jgi:hypothetical protein
MRSRRYLLSVASLVAVGSLGFSTGSGTNSGAATQLQQGWRSLSSLPQVTMSLHMDTTVQELEALPGGTPPNVAKLIAGGSIVVREATASGRPLSSLRQLSGLGQELSSVELDVVGELDGSPLVELRAVGGVLYAQLNVAGLGSVLASLGRSLSAAEGQLPPAVAADPAVHALFDGEWVSLDLESALRQLGSAGVIHSGSAGRAQARGLVGALSSALAREVHVAKLGQVARLGTDLVLSADAQNLAKALLSAASQVLPKQVTSKEVSQAVARLPHRTAQLHAYVAGGTLTRISLDLAQLAKKGELPAGTTLPLVLEVSHAPVAITAPSGAVPLDLQRLIQEAAR